MTAEMIMQRVTGNFWTRLDEMSEELEEMGFEVTSVTYEYVTVAEAEAEPQDDTDREFILYLGHANTTMWIESAREGF